MESRKGPESSDELKDGSTNETIGADFLDRIDEIRNELLVQERKLDFGNQELSINETLAIIQYRVKELLENMGSVVNVSDILFSIFSNRLSFHVDYPEDYSHRSRYIYPLLWVQSNRNYALGREILYKLADSPIKSFAYWDIKTLKQSLRAYNSRSFIPLFLTLASERGPEDPFIALCKVRNTYLDPNNIRILREKAIC